MSNWFYQQTPHQFLCISLINGSYKIDKIQPWNPNSVVKNESTISLPSGSDSPGCTLGDSTKDKLELSQKARVRKAKWNMYQRIPRICSSRSQPRKGVCRPQSQNQMPITHGGTSTTSSSRSLCRIRTNKLLFSNTNKVRFTGSPEAALNAHTCTHWGQAQAPRTFP